MRYTSTLTPFPSGCRMKAAIGLLFRPSWVIRVMSSLIKQTLGMGGVIFVKNDTVRQETCDVCHHPSKKISAAITKPASRRIGNDCATVHHGDRHSTSVLISRRPIVCISTPVNGMDISSFIHLSYLSSCSRRSHGGIHNITQSYTISDPLLARLSHLILPLPSSYRLPTPPRPRK